jgi:hypothetical protein
MCRALLLIPSAITLVRVFDSLDLESFLGEQCDDLVCQETQDVDNVVVGLAICHHSKASPLTEALAFAESERCLSTLGKVQILFGIHAFGALVCLFKTCQSCCCHFVFFLVFFVFALWDLLAVET